METVLTTDSFNELNRAKNIITQFIRSCSHNLKNPLSSIEGLAKLAEYCTSPVEVSQCLQMIQQSTLKMVEMIHTLEEYIINLQREFDQNEIEAEQLIERILEEYADEIDSNKIVVTTNVSQSNKWIADEYCNYVILRNLIGNAIHFANNDAPLKEINIKVGVQFDNVIVEVSDNGIGIHENYHTNLFEPFQRASEKSRGNGLGLFLVKGLIDKLNASISVWSTENVGTSFTISMPNNLAA